MCARTSNRLTKHGRNFLFMLGNETSLPPPNKPAFINRKNINYGLDSISSAGATASLNDLTFSVFEAR